MPRITAELIGDSPQFTNAVKDWELDLRGESTFHAYGVYPVKYSSAVEGRTGTSTATLTPFLAEGC